ncbi:aconitase/3-isopropylmalate dehydratase large subunit family protein [Pantoea agglomerans]|uniref:aconitase/3-isopropylmalate dehydratase large subunit family protein n=1 Tax=Enterobacter agglomerans TaxID=549 RepID=UPI000E21322A|nr:aconitase/3-isopropylmalate dehydratase large subunit family protein [Pantoea agglomerans]MCH9407621.1 aconitase/3-isopropylmalate dehydratase large subunit family protein [Pantoea agglomerans]QTC48603.1 3-isopropylmalate dehydratase large subunit [Pantoea agglomerans]WEC75251.1 3-isopropylmalate dehydratase large subunit [Pantoea agglomerans]WNK33256.1 aconitase/3-isopropylmalate dehydratase large subunit family protein [Pantoea agglomerans]WNK38044.1 aconitase/3-isopropylmalate dehydratas
MKSNQPIVNQIIASHSGNNQVLAGELVTVDVDYVYVQDGNSPTVAKLFKDYQLTEVPEPDKIGFFFDHSVLVPDKTMAKRVNEAMEFAKKLGINIYPRGAGISHVIALENKIFKPGNIVLGADSHTCTGGAVQSLALGMGASDILVAMLTGQTWLKVPQTVHLHINGMTNKNVRAKDVMLALLNTYGQTPFLYKSIEVSGEWAEKLTLDEAASFASMAVELGAKCIFMPDGQGRPEGLLKADISLADSVIDFSVSDLTPYIAPPHSPLYGKPVNDFVGVKFDYIFIGSCTNSRLEDIKEVAEVVEGKVIHPDIHCLLTPGSKSVYLQAIEAGYIDTLIRSGVIVTPPGCGACVGTQGTIPADGEKVLSTMNRNFKGRMGNGNADIFLCSPRTAAIVALNGTVPVFSGDQ